MAASTNDFFEKVGSPGTSTNLSAPGHAISGTSITVVSTANWPTTTGAPFAMDTFTTVNGVEVRNVGSYTEWSGVVASSTSITNMVLRYGTDQVYPAGANTRVYIPVSSSRENRLVDGLLVSLAQDGTILATSPKIITSINDTNGNELISLTSTSSAVNQLTVTNAATGTSPILSATGGDTNIGINIKGKGTGAVLLNNTSLPTSSLTTGSSTTTNTAYALLADSVSTSSTVTIGTNGLALVSISSFISNASSGGEAYVSFAVSGASTVASTDANCLMLQMFSANAEGYLAGSFLITGLTAGSTTFTMQYKVQTTQTGTFKNRRIAVTPL